MAEKIIIASGKGGSGKTTGCTGIAMSLSAWGHSVLVVDCDIAQGCIEFMLGAEENAVYNWGDVILGNCKLSDAIMSTNGVDYINAPNNWNEKFTTEAFNKLVETVQGGYSYILFDSPAGLLGGFLLAAHCADRGVLVTTPDEICVRAAARAYSELYDIGVKDCRLIINRFDKEPTQKGKFLNVDEAIDCVGVQLIGVVPEDRTIRYASNKGFYDMKDCPAKAAYERIAMRLSGKNLPLDLTGTKTNRKRHPVLKGFLITFIITLLVALIAAAGVFFTDCYMAINKREPLFEIKPYTTQFDNYTCYHGFCYKYYVEKDEDGKIVSTNMTVLNRVVAGAKSGKTSS